jgi:hypothetical protein
MNLHPTTSTLLPTLLGPGLGVTIHATPVGGAPTQYRAVVRVDEHGLAVLPDRITETGTVRSDKNGPTVSHRITAYWGQPGLLLTLVVKNGEMESWMTPHLEDVVVTVDPPPGWGVVSLGAPSTRDRLLQGARWTIRFVLVPNALALDPGLRYAIDHRAWIHTAQPRYVDGMPRPAPFQGLDWTRVDDEGPLTTIDQGGATSGNLVRLGDWGCELAHLPLEEQYDIAWEHIRLVELRQRGYLTLHGAPLTADVVSKNFRLSMGPTERMFATKTANPYSFDEDWVVANAGSIMGSIDAAHDGRAFQYAAFLAQRFQDLDAKDWIADHAAARRLETPTLIGLPKGQLARQHAWGIMLQTLDRHLNETGAAETWVWEAGRVLAEHQRANGGFCAWLSNKEALTYALDYKRSVGLPETVEPVTRPEQEMLLAMAAHMAVGNEAVPENALRFVFQTCRAPAARGPWVRCGIDGKQLDHAQTNFYSGNAIALALHLGMPEAEGWLAAYCNGLTDRAAQIKWLRSAPPPALRNTFLLIGVLEAKQ